MQAKKDFRVHLGDPVQLQFIPQDGRERLSAKVIGHAPGKSLIISAPHVQGKLSFLKESQPFIVRMLQGNHVYGFESTVLKFYSAPFPHVHLSHPEDVECIEVRGSRRVETELIVSVSSDNSPGRAISVTMLDTSASGALLQTRDELGSLNDEITISVEMEVAGQKKYLRLKATIRNITPAQEQGDAQDKLNKYGVQFSEMSEDQVLIVNAYVYEQIIKQIHDQ